jgi:transcriptional regulator with XRE-family HTH domain
MIYITLQRKSRQHKFYKVRDFMSFTPSQCRGARGLLGWSQSQLCEAANVSPATLANFETGKRTPFANNLAAIRAALEAAGVEFIDDTGVKLRA